MIPGPLAVTTQTETFWIFEEFRLAHGETLWAHLCRSKRGRLVPLGTRQLRTLTCGAEHGAFTGAQSD